MEKFLGIGLKKAFALALFTMVVIVVMKVIFTKYHISGLSEVIQSV